MNHNYISNNINKYSPNASNIFINLIYLIIFDNLYEDLLLYN